MQRVLALNTLSETLVLGPGQGEERIDLSTFRFRPGVLHPRGDQFLVKFEKDQSVRWHYHVKNIRVQKTVHLFRDAPGGVAITYAISRDSASTQALRMLVRPLVSLRDFHSLILRDTSRDRFRVEVAPAGDQCVIFGPAGALNMAVTGGGAGGPTRGGRRCGAV